MSDINLTASMRSNLLSLQNTQDLMDMTSERLSTGLKVNSAIDNPSSYYTASSLDNRATDLSSLLDSMGQGISTLKATDEAIMSITNFVEQAKAIVSTTADLVPDHPEYAEDTSVTLGGAYAAPAAAGTWSMEVSLDGSTTPRTITVEVEAAMTEAEFNTALEDSLNATFGKETFTAVDGDISLIDGNNTTRYTFGAISANPAGADVGYTAPAAADANVNNFIPAQTERAEAHARFSEIMIQIDNMAGDASYKGINLLDGSDADLTVYFNEDRSSRIKIDGVDATSAGLGLVDPTTGVTAASFEDNIGLEKALVVVDSAIDQLRGYASDFGNNYAIVQNREDFTDNLVNVLTEGADKLTLADMNEESANMLALQTRQELATNSLSLSSQAAQSVLRLFG